MCIKLHLYKESGNNICCRCEADMEAETDSCIEELHKAVDNVGQLLQGAWTRSITELQFDELSSQMYQAENKLKLAREYLRKEYQNSKTQVHVNMFI